MSDTRDPLRLGREVTPTFQFIHLNLDARRADFSGSTTIDLTVHQAVDQFRFHARNMSLDRLTLTAPSEQHITVTHAPATEKGLVIVTPKSPIAPGAYRLHIEFSSTFNTQAASLYRLETDGHAYCFTQFESDDARGAFPCWDEPEFKYPFQMSLAVPDGHMAVTNTPPESTSATGTLFQKTPPMPTYLLAIATGPLEELAVPGLAVPGRILTPVGQSKLAAEAAKVTAPVLAALEAYFGRPYPYAKLDQISVPEFWPGAMENVGLITYADSILLIDSRAMSVAQKRNLVAIMAHELSHMWFGNLVTMEWWDDLWLNESFASWMGDKITHQLYPELSIDTEEIAGADRAMLTDAKLSTRAIRQHVAANENFLQAADELAYQKGQRVLGMFERWIGPDKFRQGVIDYLQAHEWGNAVAADLWHGLGNAAGSDVYTALVDAMATFLDQGGVPLVSVELADGGVMLRQQRFLNYGVTAPPALWHIPVVLKLAGGASKTVLLTTAEQFVPLDATDSPIVATPMGAMPAAVAAEISTPAGAFVADATSPSAATDAARPSDPRVAAATRNAAGPHAWIHPNAGEEGYYRWKVPATMLVRMIADGGLSVRERVGLITNLSALLDAGEIRGDEYLRVLGSLASDEAPQVINALLSALSKVEEAFITTELQDDYAAYLRKTLGPAMSRWGMEKQPGEPEAVSFVRPRLLYRLADKGRDTTLLAHAEHLAASYRRDPASIDPALATNALRLSAIRGDNALFDAYSKAFETTQVPADRQRYLVSLGEFRAPAMVDRAMAFALDGPLRPQEVLTIPNVVSQGDLANDNRSYEWMTANYAAIAKRLPPDFVAFLPQFADGCSAERLEAATVFFADPAHQVEGTHKELAKVADSVTNCVNLRKREGQAVAQFLKSS